MKLNELLVGTEVLAGTEEVLVISKPVEAQVTSLAYDSRKVRPGAMFFALPGVKADGNRFVAQAIERGAVAVASERPQPSDLQPPVAWVQVSQARKALAAASANFFGRPADALKLVGITGTNGKTTTSFLVDSMLRAAGRVAGLFGTIVYRTPAATRVASTTTPESLDLQGFLAEVRDAGGTHAVLEVSSHALMMDRVWGCPFQVAVFTNLTQDHLDFHRTFRNYFTAKQRLFIGTGRASPHVGVINSDDPYGKLLVGLAGTSITYGLKNGAQVRARKFDLSMEGLEFTAETPAGQLEIRSPLVGRINVYNILAAIGAGIGLGLDRAVIVEGIRQLQSVPGRFERIEEGQPFMVVVDYAHTDDALRNLIETARELRPTGRILTLFGAGGDRDRTKRPKMGEAAGSGSDLVVLTSDNPRSEDPLRIINDVVVGLQRLKTEYRIEPDRRRAVELILEEARPGDIVLLAGKGHETYQVLRDQTIEFDDRAVARELLRARGAAQSAD